MTCTYCTTTGITFDATCPRCIARYALSLPTDQQEADAIARFAEASGIASEAIRKAANQLRAERMAADLGVKPWGVG